MGEMMWVAADPNTVAFQEINATQIKSFGGIGGVLSAAIDVIKFMPKIPVMARVFSRTHVNR